MRLRQVALVAQDLEATVADLCAVLGGAVPFRDPGVSVFGLCNAVLPLGDTFVEVIAPVREDASAARYRARRGGDAGYMVMLETDALDAARKRADGLGIRTVWEIELPDIRAAHLHPRDLGGALLSLDEPHPPGAWRWAGPDWPSAVHNEFVRGLVGAEIADPDPQGLARRWSTLLEHDATLAHGGAEIALSEGVLRFVPCPKAAAGGLCGVDLAVTDADAVLGEARGRGLPTAEAGFRLCGTEFRLV